MKKTLILLILLTIFTPLFSQELKFEVKDTFGSIVSSEIFKDSKLTMVNLWGTFCSPCIGEMPDLARLDKEYKDKGFKVIGFVLDAVDIRGRVKERVVNTSKQIALKTGAFYPHLIPNKGMFDDVQAVPTTLFVDSNGNVIETLVGARSYAEWKKVIEKYL